MTQQSKEISYQATERHVGILNAHCSVKEASTKAIYYVILTKWHSSQSQSIEIKKKIIGCQGNRENGEWKSRWSTGHFSSSETLLRV